MKKKEKFEKVLYRPQPYPDNHTEEKLFLKSLKRNKNLKNYSFLQCVDQGQLPLQQLSCTISFFLLHFMDIKITDNMIYIMALITMFGYLSIAGFTVHQVRTVILFGGFLFGLSPIIQTLTRSISDDTIYAMVSICLFTNFFLHDYSTERCDYMSKSVSLNAAILAAVCLASRLDDLNNVMGTIIIAILTYGIIPPVRKRMAGSKVMPLWTLFLLTSSVYISYVSVPIVIVPLIISAVACLVVVPAFFVHLQKQKDNIFGPWDEAVLKDLGCNGGVRDIYAE